MNKLLLSFVLLSSLGAVSASDSVSEQELETSSSGSGAGGGGAIEGRVHPAVEALVAGALGVAVDRTVEALVAGALGVAVDRTVEALVAGALGVAVDRTVEALIARASTCSVPNQPGSPMSGGEFVELSFTETNLDPFLAAAAEQRANEALEAAATLEGAGDDSEPAESYSAWGTVALSPEAAAEGAALFTPGGGPAVVEPLPKVAKLPSLSLSQDLRDLSGSAGEVVRDFSRSSGGTLPGIASGQCSPVMPLAITSHMAVAGKPPLAPRPASTATAPLLDAPWGEQIANERDLPQAGAVASGEYRPQEGTSVEMQSPRGYAEAESQNLFAQLKKVHRELKEKNLLAQQKNVHAQLKKVHMELEEAKREEYERRLQFIKEHRWFECMLEALELKKVNKAVGLATASRISSERSTSPDYNDAIEILKEMMLTAVNTEKAIVIGNKIISLEEKRMTRERGEKLASLEREDEELRAQFIKNHRCFEYKLGAGVSVLGVGMLLFLLFSSPDTVEMTSFS